MLVDFRDRGGREKNIKVRNINQLPPICAPTGDQTCNRGGCPDWNLNPWRFDLWDNAPTNWATLARTKGQYLLIACHVQSPMLGLATYSIAREKNVSLKGYHLPKYYSMWWNKDWSSNVSGSEGSAFFSFLIFIPFSPYCINIHLTNYSSHRASITCSVKPPLTFVGRFICPCLWVHIILM